MPKKPLPDFVASMQASSVKEPLDSPDWIFETKLDVYRAIGVLDSTGKAEGPHKTVPREANCTAPSREHREKSVGINLRKPPEIACDVTRRVLSFEWESTQI